MDDQALLPKTIFDSRYEIVGLAGSGGMGSVYRAWHTGLQKNVAIKLLHKDLAANPESIKRFKQEAQVAVNLKHHGIASVLAFDIYDEQPYIVFDFLEGASLDEVLERSGILKFQHFLRVFSEACDALAYAHEQGVLHRDLKPANIFLLHEGTPEEQVRILDFGIAKIIGPKSGQTQTLTSTGTLLGTPLYMSPEQGSGGTVSFQSDVYSLGCVMYHACYGAPPFTGESAYEILFKHTYETAVLDTVPGGYPEKILAVLQKAMAKQPLERYDSIRALGEAVAALASEPILPQGKTTKKNKKVVPATNKKAKVEWSPALTKALLTGAVSLTVAGLSFGAMLWFQAHGSVSPAEIAKGWRSGRDTHALRQQMKQLAINDPVKATELLSSLNDELMIYPSEDALGIFIDVLKAAGGGLTDEQIRPYVDNARFVATELPESEWTAANSQVAQLALQTTNLRHQGSSPEARIARTLEMYSFLHLEGHDVAGNRFADEYMKEIGKPGHMDSGMTGTILTRAKALATDVFVDADNIKEKRALTLADFMSPNDEPYIRVATLNTKAEICDACSDWSNGAKYRREALEILPQVKPPSKASHDSIMAVNIDVVLGLADEAAMQEQKNEASQLYQRAEAMSGELDDEFGPLNSLKRAALGFVALNDEQQARSTAEQILSKAKVLTDRGKQQNQALVVCKGLFFQAVALRMLGRPAEAFPLLVDANKLATKLPAEAAAAVHFGDGILATAVVFELQSEQKIATMSAAARDAAKIHQKRALRAELMGDWFGDRGNRRQHAEHYAAAATERRQIVGNNIGFDALVAADEFAVVNDFVSSGYWAEIIRDSQLDPHTRAAGSAILAHALYKQNNPGRLVELQKESYEELEKTQDMHVLQLFYDHGDMILSWKKHPKHPEDVSKLLIGAEYQLGRCRLIAEKYGAYDFVPYRQAVLALIPTYRDMGEPYKAVNMIATYRRLIKFDPRPAGID